MLSAENGRAVNIPRLLIIMFFFPLRAGGEKMLLLRNRKTNEKEAGEMMQRQKLCRSPLSFPLESGKLISSEAVADGSVAVNAFYGRDLRPR